MKDDYQEKLEQFVRHSIRYQITLAKHVAYKNVERVYVFDRSNYFVPHQECSVEVVDGKISTLIKNDKRAVLSIAVRSAFGTDENMFLKFIDQEDDVQEDDIGVYVTPLSHQSENA
jgi:hypothetical protein